MNEQQEQKYEYSSDESSSEDDEIQVDDSKWPV